jgi:hypothetical protein
MASVAPSPLRIGHPLEQVAGLQVERRAETVEGVGREPAEQRAELTPLRDRVGRALAPADS